MDDRKKRIGELEKRKKEQIVLLDAMLVRLGETLFERLDNCYKDSSGPDVDSVIEDLSQYRQLQNDIAASHDSIEVVEEQLRQCRELDERIITKEREESACSKELTIACRRLGKLLLDSPADPGGFCAPYRDQAEALFNKVQSLEDRISGLEQQDSGNVFSWIGKSTQGLVLRSFLSKALENLENLYRNIGDRYSRRGTLPESESVDDEIMEVCAGIEQKRAAARALSLELAAIREDRRAISGSFSTEGGSHKHIQSLKNHIARARDDLKILYRRIGMEAVASSVIEPAVENDRRQVIEALAVPEDEGALESAARINQAIRDDDLVVAKLKASLAIDDENAKIDKCRKLIQEKKEKIAQAERNIAEYERNIHDSEASIEKLQNLL